MQLERTPTDSDLVEYGPRIVVDERAHLPDNTHSLDVKQVQDHMRYNDLEQDKRVKLRTRIEDLTHLVYLQIAKVQFGIWYNSSNSPGTERSFSVEYEREVVRRGAAYLSVDHEHKHIRIEVRVKSFPVSLYVYLKVPLTQIGERETEETNTLILVKFSSIRKFGFGQDESGKTCESILQHYQSFAQLRVDLLQASYSIYIHHPISSKKLTNSGPNARENTRLASLYPRSTIPTPASHHMPTISVLSSLIQTISPNLRRYATSWSVNRVPSAFPLWMLILSNSSRLTTSLMSGGG